MDNDESTSIFSVVVNHEGQYSVWPVARQIPGGWNKEGYVGSRESCLEHIGRVWTDIRPISAR